MMKSLPQDFYSLKELLKITTAIESFSKGMNTVTVHIKENAAAKSKSSDRNFYMTSSCGVCGKSSIDSVRTNSQYKIDLQRAS
jgi:FdhD protein